MSARSGRCACGCSLQARLHATKRDDGCKTSQRMSDDVDGDAVQLLDQRRIEHPVDWPRRQYAAALEQYQVAAQSRGEVQIMCRYDDRQTSLAVERRENGSNLELVREVERGC